MQKKMNAKIVGSIQQKGRKLEYKEIIKIDEAKTYEKVVGF